MTQNPDNGSFPNYRPRRLRQSAPLRRLVQETRVSLDQYVMPYFVREGKGIKEAISSMPGQFRFSTDTLLTELNSLVKAGISSVLLFGIPEHKDEKASGAYSSKSVVAQAIREIKKRFPELIVMTDVCLCAYTAHGHCGLLNSKGEIENDSTLPLLADMALAHAEAGADLVAPSAMMDGRIRAIRSALDKKGFQNLPIMSYAAKFSSAFYGPFREAAHSSPSSGDRKTYQMDPANREEALREIAQDIQEGADIVMVKPALAYMDILREAADRFHFPLAAYSVSGEYSMIKAAAQAGFADEKAIVQEMMTGLARAGARILITYHAKDLALWE